MSKSGPFCFVLIIVAIFLLESEVSSHSFSQEGPLHFQDGEEVHISFVTSLRHKREIHRNDYHILEVARQRGEPSFQIHLAKNEHLLSPEMTILVSDGNSSTQVPVGGKDQSRMDDGATPMMGRDESHCAYSGVVSGAPFNGKVALSACGDKPGFSGVLMTDTSSYILEPVPGAGNTDGEAIPHTITPMKEEDVAHTCGGAISAPAEELPEETMAAPQPPVPMSTGKQYLKLKRRPASRGKVSTKPSAQSTPSSYTVELAIFADQSFVERMKKKFGSSDDKEMRGFVYVLVQSMAIFYQHPSLEDRIDFKIVHMDFFKKNPGSINTNHGSLTPFLESFCKYARKQDPTGKKWDHAMHLTAVDLREGSSTAPIGVAYLNGACTTNIKCSVIEVTSFASASTMAHEIGHNLGMEHDGEGKNTRCDGKKHIMAPINYPKQVAFSSCSNSNLRDYLKLLVSSGSGRRSTRTDCLRSLSSTSEKKYNYESKTLPGENFTPNMQCKAADEKRPVAVTGSMASRFSLSGNICEELYCTDSKKTYALYVHAALEGTECAKGKWCKQGSCVKKS